MVETLTPQFSIRVGSTDLEVGVTQLIRSVVFEDTDGIADMGKIILQNPDYAISDSKLFQPGNEVSFFMGYDGELKHVGRIRIYKVRPLFGVSEMPSIEITGYSRDHEMMHNSPPQAAPAGRSGGKGAGAKRSQSQSGRRFKNVKYSEAVEQRAGDYGFSLDVDPSPSSPTDFIQKAGMTDYEFVNGLANLTGYIFWVDADENGKWTLHFRDPEKLKEQDSKFKFEHNIGNLSTLWEFEPEFLVSESIAHIRVRVLNTNTGKVIETEFSEDSLSGSPDVEFAGSPEDKVDKSPEQSQSVQLFIGDFSFYEVSNRKFLTEADAEKWAKQWFRRNRENFIFAKGKSIGVNTIRSRQVHEIAGTGRVYSGDYYFSRVAHTCNDDEGYTLDFTCRKQTPKI